MVSDSQENEQMLAAMVRYLFETGKPDSAKALINTKLAEYSQYRKAIGRWNDEYVYAPAWLVLLRGPAAFVKEIVNKVPTIDEESGDKYDAYSQLYDDVQEAFDALAPLLDQDREDQAPTTIEAKLELIAVDTDWRSMMLAEIETDKPKNQGPLFAKKEKVIVYEGQKFASPPEVEIAKALDRVGVMYFPNCLARVGFRGMRRENRFPDFLITYKGKWGILEVDGETYHTTASATQDHERTRILEQHGGIRYFTRYTAQKCMNEPDKIVQQFLGILETR